MSRTGAGAAGVGEASRAESAAETALSYTSAVAVTPSSAEFEHPPDLQEILRRAARGEEDAWGTLVATYFKRVYGLVRAQCNNGDLAEEITQSTFCTIAEKLPDYTEIGRFEAWLFRIAMNRLRDEMRRRKRQARTVADEALTGLIDAQTAQQRSPGRGADPAPPGLDPDTRGRLLQALEQLSEADRKIVYLRHLAGLSFKQIAEVQNQPMGTVLARHHRALKKLRDQLGELAAEFTGSGGDE